MTFKFIICRYARYVGKMQGFSSARCEHIEQMQAFSFDLYKIQRVCSVLNRTYENCWGKTARYKFWNMHEMQYTKRY